jgi:formate transporter
MADSDIPSTFTPLQIYEKVIISGIAKSKLSFTPMFLLALLAGMYIAFGGFFSTVVATGMIGIWPYGLMKVLQGLVFSLGLILVVVGGAELFTGNMLMVIPFAARKIPAIALLRNWLVVFIGNFLGSLFVAFLMLTARTYAFASGEFGKTILIIANSKMHYSFIQAFSLAILCNILVCLAVWLAFSARNTTDKIMAIVFPITAFIAAGFEHSVANMYLIPVAVLLKFFDPAFTIATGIEVSALNWVDFLFKNLVPVSLGNMIGGIFFVGLIYFFIYNRHISVSDSKQ